jgi:hypothetical protein
MPFSRKSESERNGSSVLVLVTAETRRQLDELCEAQNASLCGLGREAFELLLEREEKAKARAAKAKAAKAAKAKA